MAKGAYFFISYPESSDINRICEVLQGAGAEYAYILHDKDIWDDDGEDKQGNKHKAGDTKKPHYHILAGWDKGFPSWKTFKFLADSCGAVAISKDRCLVKDIFKCYDYMYHKGAKPISDMAKAEKALIGAMVEKKLEDKEGSEVQTSDTT